MKKREGAHARSTDGRVFCHGARKAGKKKNHLEEKKTTETTSFCVFEELLFIQEPFPCFKLTCVS